MTESKKGRGAINGWGGTAFAPLFNISTYRPPAARPSLPFLLSVSLTLLFWPTTDIVKVAVPPDLSSFVPSANSFHSIQQTESAGAMTLRTDCGAS